MRLDILNTKIQKSEHIDAIPEIMKDGVRKTELDDVFLERKKDGVRKNDKNEWFTVEVRRWWSFDIPKMIMMN